MTWSLRIPRLSAATPTLPFCATRSARAGIVTYYGPNFTSFMIAKGLEYTIRSFRACLFENGSLEIHPAETWSDDAWHNDQENRTFHESEGFWPIQQGEAEGMIIGGNCWCLNMLQGTAYFPPLDEAILFLENAAQGKATLMALDSGLLALAFQPGFSGVRGIVLGGFDRSGGVTREGLTELIGSIPAAAHLPVIANCDFGHTTPVFTVPIGGRCAMRANASGVSITFDVH